MRKDLTDIVVVLDRSGSMSSRRSDAIGGLNAFIDAQKKLPGEANFTLVQFDNEYEYVHRCVPIKDVPACDLQPRGGTALLDAIGFAMTETGARLAAMPEDQRPGLVVFVIVTDGLENASREFRPQVIKQMIATQEKDYSWQFTYLGANQDAFAAGFSLGITRGTSANYVSTTQAFAASSNNVSRMRSSTYDAALVSNSYLPEELAAMNMPVNHSQAVKSE